MSSRESGSVLILGSEPSAFSCAFSLLEAGLQVQHIYLSPLGVLGASRDIGLAYPELGEPYERILYSLGEDLALEYHSWARCGIEDLQARLGEFGRRGSRLFLTRTESEAKLVADDAILRSKPPVSDELRLMSGAAASNFVPVDGANQGTFETHALAFTPVRALEELSRQLLEYPLYKLTALETVSDWEQLQLECRCDDVQAKISQDKVLTGDLVVVCAGVETSRLAGSLSQVLVPILGQAFRTPPLKEKMRTSVLGVTASWGYEKYRFDDNFRLLACGIEPNHSEGKATASVDEASLARFAKRASGLFTDFDGTTENLMKWGVVFTASCDGLPVLGPMIGEPKIYVASGFSTSAWSKGWEAGRRVARALLGEEQGRNSMLKRCSVQRFGI